MRSDGRSGLAAVVLTAVLALSPSNTLAAGPSAVDEALVRLFPPPATVGKDTLFLTDEQAAAAERAAAVELPSRIVTRYVARGPGEQRPVVGFAYLDTHLVRTLPETLLIAIGVDGQVRRVEVLAFAEPPEYEASRRWFEQFEGRELDENLRLRRGIRTLSGATLSSRAATEAVRRVLAIHRVAGGGGGS